MDLVFETVPRSSRTKPQIPFARDRGDYQVWSYCGIKPNPRADSRPNVVVGVRKRVDGGRVEDKLRLHDVPLSDLGQVRLGTIWNRARCVSGVALEEQVCLVNFDRGCWRHTSFFMVGKERPDGQRYRAPYPYELYPTGYSRDRNFLLEFDLCDPQFPNPSDPDYKVIGRLVVPCLEFFSRVYGRSQFVTRVLATYSLLVENGALDRLVAGPPEALDPARWWVTLRKQSYNADAVFLAHLLHDPFTRKTARAVYDQMARDLESQANIEPLTGQIVGDASNRGSRKRQAPTFPKVAPWFRGEATMKVKGYPFGDGNSFLALRVDGLSDPDGPPIDLYRENDGGGIVPMNVSEEQGERTRLNRQDRIAKNSPEPIESSRNDEPDYGGSTQQVEDDHFEIMDHPRDVRRVKRQSADSVDTIPGKMIDAPERAAAGESRGPDKGTGKLSLIAPTGKEPAVIEKPSGGSVHDMWNALVRTAKEQTDSIAAIGFYTLDGGVQFEDVPRLITLRPFRSNDTLVEKGERLPIPSDVWRWVYVAPGEPRGILVVRIVTPTLQNYCIVDIERKPPIVDVDGSEREREPLTGLAFKIESGFDFEDWLHHFLHDIRIVKGVISNLAKENKPSFPPGAQTFQHSKARKRKDASEKGENFVGEFAARHALVQAGMILSKARPPAVGRDDRNYFK